MLYIFDYELYVVIMYKHFYCHIIDKYVFSYLEVSDGAYSHPSITQTTRQQ